MAGMHSLSTAFTGYTPGFVCVEKDEQHTWPVASRNSSRLYVTGVTSMQSARCAGYSFRHCLAQWGAPLVAWLMQRKRPTKRVLPSSSMAGAWHTCSKRAQALYYNVWEAGENSLKHVKNAFSSCRYSWQRRSIVTRCKLAHLPNFQRKRGGIKETDRAACVPTHGSPVEEAGGMKGMWENGGVD